MVFPLPYTSPYRLLGIVQRYAWGKIGTSSLVGRLSGFGQSENTSPFAELWFGAHPKSSSVVKSGSDELPLDQFLRSAPLETLGSHSLAHFGASLPFLFKVLSVARPLSIQLHPDLKTAGELFKRNPRQYPDGNHKPELSVAISQVQLLCGMKPYCEIVALLARLPELVLFAGLDLALLTTATGEKALEHVTRLVYAIFNAPSASRADLIRLASRHLLSADSLDPDFIWFQRACSMSAADDPGLLFMLLLKQISLEPGESVYIPANLPHAYLSGDLVECMANSDNVVRAGLTDKFIDTATFLSLVHLGADQDCRLPAIHDPEEGVFIYAPPVPDFQLRRYSGSEISAAFRAEGPAIFFCLKGSATLRGTGSVSSLKLQAGQAAFLPAMGARPPIDLHEGDLFVASCSPKSND